MKNMNKISLIAICFLSVLIFSCKEESKTEPAGEATTETASAQEMQKNMEKSADLKYNPEHGVEGHRCDLPVGAPLEQASTATPASIDMSTSPVRLKSASPVINPPHGEPGHDCSVPVGAKLEG